MSDAQKCARFEYNERTVAVTEARCEILDLLSQGLDAKVVPDHCRIRFFDDVNNWFIACITLACREGQPKAQFAGRGVCGAL